MTDQRASLLFKDILFKSAILNRLRRLFDNEFFLFLAQPRIKQFLCHFPDRFAKNGLEFPKSTLGKLETLIETEIYFGVDGARVD